MIGVRQRGFSAVEVVIAVVVVGAIAATGYLAYSRMNDAGKTPSASEQTTVGNAPSAPAIDDATDLDSATQTMNQTNIDASLSDSSELDSQLNGF